VTSSDHAYLQRSALCSMPWSRLGRRRGVFWGKNCCPCVGVTGQGNHCEFIPTVSVESQHSTGVPTCNDFPRFVIVSEKSQAEVGNRWLWSSKNWVFWEKRPLTGKFSRMFSKAPHADTETRLFVQISWNLTTGSRWNHALFNGQKTKTKFRLALPLPLLWGSRPKFVRDSSK